MKRITIFPVLIILFLSCHSQPDAERSEFTTNPNGLMYSEGDMKHLRFIVDSLTLRFKTCDLNKVFWSKPQTKTYTVTFQSETNDLKEIIEDMKAGIPPGDLLKKYASFIKTSNVSRIIIKSGKDTYLSGSPASGYDRVSLTDEKKFNARKISNKWSYTYDPKGEYQKYNSLDGFFFSGEFESVSIPAEYGKLIQYVDCMIDTSSVVFLTDKADRRYDRDEMPVYAEINNYINTAMKRKKNGKDDWEFNYISADKIKYATEQLKNDYSFIHLIENAAIVCTETNQSNDGLEALIGEFASKEKALYLKRCRRVVGQCSMDDSPRLHARSIALLAAEAHNWDIFLRAHLDIMNDRFERVSDGSYAWGQRKTYLKELEELNLNIVDLMLGLTLRTENAADNHYYGTIWRMGRALSESREKYLFEKKAIAIMKDNLLDEFNRGLVFLLYHSYTNYLENGEGKKKRDELRNTIDSFPDFIQASINSMAEPKGKERG
ncbi:MAG: hypothetical protein ACT4OJ_16115 [Bacteroidota bacterium]